MLKGTLKSLATAALLATSAIAANAADFTIRATANSNENDEDYDGLVVFKNYVESASNGAIAVELFMVRNCVQTVQNVCKVWPMAPSTYIFRHLAVRQVSSHTFKYWTFLT